MKKWLRRNRDGFIIAGGALFLLALLTFGIWAWFAGPCWLYNFASTADGIPGRCVIK